MAEPDSPNVHKARARIYKERRYEELSLMAQGIFGYAAKQERDRTIGWETRHSKYTNIPHYPRRVRGENVAKYYRFDRKARPSKLIQKQRKR